MGEARGACRAIGILLSILLPLRVGLLERVRLVLCSGRHAVPCAKHEGSSHHRRRRLRDPPWRRRRRRRRRPRLLYVERKHTHSCHARSRDGRTRDGRGLRAALPCSGPCRRPAASLGRLSPASPLPTRRPLLLQQLGSARLPDEEGCVSERRTPFSTPPPAQWTGVRASLGPASMVHPESSEPGRSACSLALRASMRAWYGNQCPASGARGSLGFAPIESPPWQPVSYLWGVT